MYKIKITEFKTAFRVCHVLSITTTIKETVVGAEIPRELTLIGYPAIGASAAIEAV